MAKKRGNRKKPKAGVRPPAKKSPRVPSQPPPVPTQRPTWRFQHVDTGGPWCWTKMSAADCEKVVDKLRNLESMCWGDIEGPNHHFLSATSLSSEAESRLREINKDSEQDLVFSLKISAKKRVVGIRYDACLHFLWWDPNHKVAPSTKRHT